MLDALVDLADLAEAARRAHPAWGPAVELILWPTLAAYLMALAAIRRREVARRGEGAPES